MSVAPCGNFASAVDPSLTTQVSQLQGQVAALTERLRKAQEDRDEYHKLILLLREENEHLKRGLLGQKAERLPANDAQLTMAVLGLAFQGQGGTGDAAPPAAPTGRPERRIPAHLRRKPVRKALPASLPRIHIDILPPQVQRRGLDAFTYIGSDKREVLERRPASTVVVEIEYKKFVPKDRDPLASTPVLVPPPIELPIARGLAGPALLADTIVRRWQDHLPLHRLQGIYAREGLALSRSTLCLWHQQLAPLVRPLVDAMFQDAYQSPSLCTDATGTLVQAKERCRAGPFWVLVVPQRHVLFRFSAHHDGKAVDALLKDYKGYLVADAHTVYDHLFLDGSLLEVGCWAHARRYFFKALPADPPRARHALSFINALFLIERELAGAPHDQRHATRLVRSKPLLEQFLLWCDCERDHVLDLSPLATAIGYVRNQRHALSRFLHDGRLPLHNNFSELNLRRLVLGRKNWLFCGSHDGAEVTTLFVSLLASCSLHHIEPLAYLRDLLCLLPDWPLRRVLDLAPVCWPQTLQEPDTQQRLAANLIRSAVLNSS